MKKFFLAFSLLLGLAAPAVAQVPCPGVGGVNTVPQLGTACEQEPGVASYAATGIGMVPASAATDFACLTGVAGKVVRLQAVSISGTAGTLINVPVTLNKNASLDTGGTANTGTALPVPYRLDSINAAPGATATSYTANPTINDTAPGLIDSGVVVLTATGTLAGNTGLTFNYLIHNFIEAPTLRKATEQICVNLNGTSPSSGVVNVTFKWTEALQ